MEQWDAIVVGSGPGGLTAAACLASAGQKVLVLERHDVAGGNTQVFRRHHKNAAGGEDWYEFDVGVHYIGECQPGGLFPTIFGALGVGDRLRFRPLDADGFDTLLFPDFTFRVPAGWDEYERRLTAAIPEERAGIERCIRTLRAVAEESRSGMFGGERPTYDQWAMRPLAELFDESELSDRARALIDHWSGLYAGGPRQTAIAMHAGIIHHYMNGAFYPEGGGQMLAARLVQVIEALGGEVRTLSAVDRILVETDGKNTRRAVGVRLADGTELRAPLVVSNADHRRTVQYLVGSGQFDPSTVDFTDQAQMTLGLVCTYVVVDKVLEGPNTNYFVFPDYRTDGLYEELDGGQLPAATFAYIAIASRKDPGNHELCPPGHTNFQVMTLAPRGYEFWGVEQGPADGEQYRRNEVYRARKEALQDRLLDAAEHVFGPLRDHIVHVETATTLSHERYTQSSGGTSYGYMHSPEQLGEHRPAHRTEIEGLFLVGANTVSGHGIAGATFGGVMCAGEILGRPLIAEVFLGTQLVSPDLIPPDPQPFDPLEYSRGAALRAKRAERVASLAGRRRGEG
jgi:phytoene dehydrogenase-like protein